MVRRRSRSIVSWPDAEQPGVLGSGRHRVDHVLGVREHDAQLLQALGDRVLIQVHPGYQHADPVRVDAALDHHRVPGQQPDPGQAVDLRTGRKGQALGLGRLGLPAPGMAITRPPGISPMARAHRENDSSSPKLCTRAPPTTTRARRGATR